MTLPNVKVIAMARRKPDMTRKEFFDYRFQVHGQMCDQPTSLDEKPVKYVQIHIFDAAYPERPGAKYPNANYAWHGRDDSIYLRFRDVAHLRNFFTSAFVREHVGPDSAFFNDYETNMSLLTIEKKISLPYPVAKGPPHEAATVAQIWLSASSGTREGSQLEERLTGHLIEALSQHASQHVYDLIADVGVVSDQFDLEGYFGGHTEVPKYSLIYTLLLTNGSSALSAARSAQKAFADSISSNAMVDATKTFIVFGKCGLVLQSEKGISYNVKRQPNLAEFS